jgi:adenylate kinase family enzyme
MPNYRRLEEKEISEIAAEYFQGRKKHSISQDVPTLVLVGGQPGAGKSAASEIARSELRQKGGFIHVDADRLRAKIDLGNSKPTSTETQVDAGKLAIRLRSIAIAERRNIVEEGTFRNSEIVAKFIDGSKREGYSVEMLAVATPREESVLGIYQRYELQHALGALNPRFVAETYHDEAMSGFVRSVAQNERNFDRFRVVDRNGSVLYDSVSKGRHIGTAASVLAKVQRVGDGRLVAIASAWQLVQAKAASRGAEPGHLARIASNIEEVTAMQKGRIHAHALRELKSHFKALDADPRFHRHSNSELGKVAYYRGMHEKAQTFAGGSTDFKAFDAAFSDRSKVRDLPKVEDSAAQLLQRTSRTMPSIDDGCSI